MDDGRFLFYIIVQYPGGLPFHLAQGDDLPDRKNLF